MVGSTRQTPLPSGIHLGVGSTAMVVVILLTGMLTEPGSVARLLIVALAAGIAAALIPDWRYGAGVVLIAYLLYIGFLVNRLGELSWDGQQSLWHLAVFVLAFWLGLGQRWMRAEPQEGSSEDRTVR